MIMGHDFPFFSLMTVNDFNEIGDVLCHVILFQIMNHRNDRTSAHSLDTTH